MTESMPVKEWTTGALLDWTAQYLAQKGCEYPRLDAEVLLAHVLDCPRIGLYTRHADLASPEVRERYRELIRRRIEGCPVAYLVGYKEFFSLRLSVSPAVLIPRPESEFVVMEALRLAKTIKAPNAIDIGTGSGNIAIAFAHEHPGARVTAVDVSAEALDLARRNAETHGVINRIRFVQGNLFETVPAGETFDFVLSNPPYIPHDDIVRLPQGVRDYEPHAALDGGPDGFAVFDALLGQSASRLRPGGCMILEIGAPQDKGARDRIEATGSYDSAPTVHDYSGHPRVLIARRR
jgi:release factor glutamine methyltransferase